MSFSNPIANVKGNAAEYVDALIAKLGDRDPWEVQRALASSVRSAIDGLTDEQLQRAEAPGKWSIAGVVQHLVECEIVYGYRMRLVIAGNAPVIQAYDQDAWARELHYESARAQPAVAELEALRNVNLRMLEGLSDQQWERYGIHTERGEESVRRMFTMIAGHDLVHLAQIARIRAQFEPQN